jgi:CBS domain-containing protein
MEAMARSRLFTVSSDTLLVEVAARLSSAHISMVVVCDAAGAAMGTITETVLVRHLGLGHADFLPPRLEM